MPTVVLKTGRKISFPYTAAGMKAAKKLARERNGKVVVDKASMGRGTGRKYQA